jgi:hypothetical protein
LKISPWKKRQHRRHDEFEKITFKVVTEQVTLKNMMFAPAYVSRRLLLVEFKVSKLSLLTPAMEASCHPLTEQLVKHGLLNVAKVKPHIVY